MPSEMPLTPSWFRVAVQALVIVAETNGLCPSSTIAQELHAHPVFLRRVCALLVQAQILQVREGREGGYRLTCPPTELTLEEIYLAIVSAPPERNGLCGSRAAHVQRVLDDVAAETEQHLLATLRRHTLASVMQRVDAPLLQP